MSMMKTTITDTATTTTDTTALIDFTGVIALPLAGLTDEALRAEVKKIPECKFFRQVWGVSQLQKICAEADAEKTTAVMTRTVVCNSYNRNYSPGEAVEFVMKKIVGEWYITKISREYKVRHAGGCGRDFMILNRFATAAEILSALFTKNFTRWVDEAGTYIYTANLVLNQLNPRGSAFLEYTLQENLLAGEGPAQFRTRLLEGIKWSQFFRKSVDTEK